MLEVIALILAIVFGVILLGLVVINYYRWKDGRTPDELLKATYRANEPGE
jgi:preprotein translocase subunit SecG